MSQLLLALLTVLTVLTARVHAACEQACPLALQDTQGCCPVDYVPPPDVVAVPGVVALPETASRALARHDQALLLLPSGVYQAGRPRGRTDERPHGVAIGEGVSLGREEVTRGLYADIMGLEPPPRDERTLPMTGVRWLDAVTFCNLLSDAEALTQVYTVAADGVTWNKRAEGYRLPTEAEWEYAARAGGAMVWAGTDDAAAVCDYANIGLGGPCDDGRDGPAPARSYKANPWGFHDLSGNVAEWVWDWYGLYPEEAEDPQGPDSGELRVVRGGSWWLGINYAKTTRRYWAPPDQSDENLGFRVARGEPMAP